MDWEKTKKQKLKQKTQLIHVNKYSINVNIDKF